jgi:hypothetical protein
MKGKISIKYDLIASARLIYKLGSSDTPFLTIRLRESIEIFQANDQSPMNLLINRPFR